MPIVFDDQPAPAAKPKRGVVFDDAVDAPATAPASSSPVLDAILSAPVKGTRGFLEGAANLATGTLAKPISDIAGLASIPMHMLGMDREPAKVQQQVASALTYEPRTEEGRLVSEYNPVALAGKFFSKAGDVVQNAISPEDTSGEGRLAVGRGVGETVRQIPALLPLAAAKAAPAVEGAARGGARGLMQSALKPTYEQLRTGKAARAIDTMLNEGVNVSRGGIEKLNTGIGGLNDQIAARIADSPAVINKAAVVSPLDELAARFTEQVNPASDVGAVNAARAEFLDHPLAPGETMPVQLAQKLKQGTNRALGDKSYGELKGAQTEAQKALTRGLREQIAEAVPGINDLNAREGSLINARDIAERRVLMDANKNPGGLGWLITHPTQFAAWMADRSPVMKSLGARGLNSIANIAGKLTPKPVPTEIAPEPLALAPDGPYRPPQAATTAAPLADKTALIAERLGLTDEPKPFGNEIDMGPFLNERRLSRAAPVESAQAAETAKQAHEATFIPYEPSGTFPGSLLRLGTKPAPEMTVPQLTINEIVNRMSLGEPQAPTGGINMPSSAPTGSAVERAIADEAVRRAGVIPDLVAPVLRDLEPKKPLYGPPKKTFDPRGGR